jgi:hypothetical protein
MVPNLSALQDDPSRRRVLKASAGTLLTGLTTSTAGCLAGLPPLGDRQSYGRVDAPAAAPPAYREWLATPAAFEYDPAEYTYLYAQPDEITGGEPEEFRYRQAVTKAQLDWFGIGYRAYDTYLNTPAGTIIGAEFDPSAVAQTLLDSGYRRDGEYAGADLFARDDVWRRVALREGTIVWSNERIHEAPDIEAVLDTHAGDRPRYHEASDSFAELTDAIGASRMVIAGPGFGDPTDRATLGADAFRFTDEAVFQVIKLHFPADDVPTTDELESAFRDSYNTTEEARTLDVEIDGQLGSIEARVPRSDPDAHSVEPLADPPQITWGVSYDPDAGIVQLRHEAGETVDADLLWYDIDTETSPGKIEKRPLWEDRDEVTPGATATVDLSERSESTAVQVFLSEQRGCCGFRQLFYYKLAWGRDDA